MIGEIAAEGGSKVTMRTKRRAAQVALALVATAAYGALLSSWGGGGGGGGSPPAAEGRWQERAPRSVAESSSQSTRHEGRGDPPPEAREAADGESPRAPPSIDTGLDDLFISVKTTGVFHRSRVNLVLKTWFNLAKEQTWFFTDTNDPEYQEKTNGHMINTNCSSSHSGKALCCKMSVELDFFLESGKRWFCHVDDDNYLNVPRLVRLLSGFDPQRDWYVGKPSIRAPLEILLPQPVPTHVSKKAARKVSFWFATGGAGFCLSRALALRMLPVASGGKFISIGERIRLPDDVTMGYIIEHILGHHLTVVEEFHSHLEPMRFLPEDSFPEQITFSYSRYGKEQNVLKIEKGLQLQEDPTRLLSLHCILYPSAEYCSG